MASGGTERTGGAVADDGSTRQLLVAVVYLALGTALVLAPAAAGPVGDYVEPDDAYTYEAVEVIPYERSLAFDGPPPDDGIRGVDCLVDYTRLCGLEVKQLDRNVTVRKVNPIEREAAPYVEFSDRYYRRVSDRNATHVTYGLRPVSTRAMLDTLAVPVERTEHPGSVRRLIRAETATIDHELARPEQVVAVNGSYYVFSLQSAETPRDGRSEGLVLFGAGVGFLAGLWSLRRGWLRYDRWRASGRGD